MILKLANPIVHQQQPTPCSCTATCIAMAFGIRVADLGVDLNCAYGPNDFGIWLAERGIWLRKCDRGERMWGIPPFGDVYLVTVLSRNVIEQYHSVLVDTRGQRKSEYERSGWVTYDPNKGREGKKHYDWVDENTAVEFSVLKQHDSRLKRAGSPPAFTIAEHAEP